MRFHLWIYLIVLVLLGAACSTIHQKNVSLGHALPFEQAVQGVANEVFKGMKSNLRGMDRFMSPNIIVDPFVNAYTQEQMQVSQQMTGTFQNVGRNYGFSKVFPLDRRNLGKNRFVIEGSLGLEVPPGGRGPKQYHFRATARDIKTGRTVATSDAWIAGKIPSDLATPEFNDSPAYFFTNLRKTPAESTISRDQLALKALLNDAGRLYAAHQYAQALGLYQQAYQQGGSKELRTLAGLYITQVRMGREQEAAKAFKELLTLSFAQKDKLTLKILFQVNSDRFYGDAQTQREYVMWSREISNYASEHSSCITITGHSSHSGTPAYNDNLSQTRADRIKSIMNPNIMNSIRVIGKGFRENIIGTGTDNAQDALDRRVEFTRSHCGG